MSVATAREAVQKFFLTYGPDATRHTLPARLIFEERRDPSHDDAKIDGLIEHDDHARTQRGFHHANTFEGERRVELIGCDEGPGGAAEQDRLQTLAAAHASSEV